MLLVTGQSQLLFSAYGLCPWWGKGLTAFYAMFTFFRRGDFFVNWLLDRWQHLTAPCIA